MACLIAPTKLLPFEVEDATRLLIVLDLDLTLINAKSVPYVPDAAPSSCDFVITNDEVVAMYVGVSVRVLRANGVGVAAGAIHLPMISARCGCARGYGNFSKR